LAREDDLFRFDERMGNPFTGALAGIDEAGRGPLAGPVVAAAVIFRRRVPLSGLNDSKKVSPTLREVLFKQILSHSLVGISAVSEQVIDRVNILQATRLAMREAVLALPKTPLLLLIDGKIRLDLPLPQVSIVRGDSQSAAIAAASIVAKVWRDHRMRAFDSIYPGYGFALHKGYPTPEHLKVLQSRGATVIHRKSFSPVRILDEGEVKDE